MSRRTGSGTSYFFHVVERFPGILRVMMRIVGRPDRHILELVPQPVNDRLVRLEADKAALVKALIGVTDRPVAALKGEKVEEILRFAEHERQPGCVRLQHSGLQFWEF